MKPLLFIARTFSTIYRLQALRIARLAFNGEGEVTIPFFGYKLNVRTDRSDMHKLLALLGERFIEERCLFEREIPVGGTVIDVGANIGYYALLFSKLVGINGTIIALEPEPSNFNELASAISLNDLKQVTPLRKAAGQSSSTLALSLGVNGRISKDEDGTIKIEVMALDEIALPKLDFVKIDVEGFEADVLLGMKEILSRKVKPTLFVEIHPWCLSSGASVASIISSLKGSYASIRFFRKDEDRSLIGKILIAYGIRPRFIEVSEETAISLEKNKVFWVLCK